MNVAEEEIIQQFVCAADSYNKLWAAQRIGRDIELLYLKRPESFIATKPRHIFNTLEDRVKYV